jgi:hypothetical protein
MACSGTAFFFYSHLKTPVFLSYCSRIFLFVFFFYFSLHLTPLPYLYSWMWLYSITIFFYKGCFQSDQHLDLSRLMHSIHCGNTIFPYQTLERWPAQETFNRLAGLRSMKNSKALNIHSVYTALNFLCNITEKVRSCIILGCTEIGIAAVYELSWLIFVD